MAIAKKLLLFSIVFILLVLPVFVLAQNQNQSQNFFAGFNPCVSPDSWVSDILGRIVSLGWVIFVGIIIVGFLIIGIIFVVSWGDPGKLEKARSAVIWAVVGVAVALIGFSIVWTIAVVLNTNVCPTGAAEGESCSADTDCQLNLWCQDGSCVSRDVGDVGYPCQQDSWCQPQFRCLSNSRCGYPGFAGAQCGANEDCVSGLACLSNNKCGFLGNEGAQCGVDDDCRSGLTCHNNICRHPNKGACIWRSAFSGNLTCSSWLFQAECTNLPEGNWHQLATCAEVGF